MLIVNDPEIEIDAGDVEETTVEEIFRNLRVLYGTRAGEQALDRDFGIDPDLIDYPQENAKALLAAEYVRKTQKYEPRVVVTRVEWTGGKPSEGRMTPKVVVSFV